MLVRSDLLGDKKKKENKMHVGGKVQQPSSSSAAASSNIDVDAKPGDIVEVTNAVEPTSSAQLRAENAKITLLHDDIIKSAFWESNTRIMGKRR